MALFTGKGDGGTTKLFDCPSGTRISKSAPIFETLGILDELNCIVGWCKVACPLDMRVGDRTVREVLRDVQDHLFTIQAETAGAPKSVPPESVEIVSARIGLIEQELPPITSFLVPGGCELSARLDIARTVSRRAERCLVTLHESGDRAISESSRAWANRLSSLLYALVRLVNARTSVEESAPAYRDAQ